MLKAGLIVTFLLVGFSGHGVVGLLLPIVLSCSTPVSSQPNLFWVLVGVQITPEPLGLQSELMQAAEW